MGSTQQRTILLVEPVFVSVMRCDHCEYCIESEKDCIWSLGKPWHYGCLRCFKCGKHLLVNLHGLENGLPTCGQRNCHTIYEHLYYRDPSKTDTRTRAREPCFRCLKPVLAPDSVNCRGRTFHACCFRCFLCDRLLSPTYFEDHIEGPRCLKPCREDGGTVNMVQALKHGLQSKVGYLGFNVTYQDCLPCMGCGAEMRVSPICLRAHGGVWHPYCLRCHRCAQLLTPECPGVLFHRKPYCSGCHPTHVHPKDTVEVLAAFVMDPNADFGKQIPCFQDTRRGMTKCELEALNKNTSFREVNVHQFHPERAAVPHNTYVYDPHAPGGGLPKSPCILAPGSQPGFSGRVIGLTPGPPHSPCGPPNRPSRSLNSKGGQGLSNSPSGPGHPSQLKSSSGFGSKEIEAPKTSRSRVSGMVDRLTKIATGTTENSDSEEGSASQ